MDAQEQTQKWQEQSESVFTHIAHWRNQHPRATMPAIEQAVDEQMNQVRAQVLHDAALVSTTQHDPSCSTLRLECPDCHVPLQPRGQRKRHLQTQGGHQVTLKRASLACPRCGYGLFPLDKKLELGPGALLPHVLHALACLPFAHVPGHLAVLFGVLVSASTVARQTEQVGRGALALQQQQALANCMVMRANEAFVPLVHGQWAEVKLLPIARVNSGPARRSECQQVHAQELSSFPPLANGESFSDQASSEGRRRGMDRAKQVVAVHDGAEGIQGVVQAHRADARHRRAGASAGVLALAKLAGEEAAPTQP